MTEENQNITPPSAEELARQKEWDDMLHNLKTHLNHLGGTVGGLPALPPAEPPDECGRASLQNAARTCNWMSRAFLRIALGDGPPSRYARELNYALENLEQAAMLASGGANQIAKAKARSAVEHIKQSNGFLPNGGGG